MEWKEVKFKDIIKLQRGFDLPKNNFEEGNYPVVGSTSVLGYHSEYKVKAPGIVTGRSGSLGTIQYITQNYWPHNTSLWVKDFKGNHVRFIYYFLQTLNFENFNSGGAVPTLNRNHLDNIKIRFPDLPIQKKIASILSAYDDLIENNKRRIELLEKAAQNIYKEWFVRMRFPGWQTAKYQENGLPEGWEVKMLGEVVDIKKGKNITKKTIKKGNIPVVAGGINPAYYHNKANTESPTITVSASGANAGFVNIYFKNIWASDCSYIDSKATKYLYFVYLYLKNGQEIVYHLQKGSAQPHVYPKDLQTLDLTFPSIEILEKFENMSNVIYQEIVLLQQKNEKLRTARNRLLPKLVSGGLSVEHLVKEKEVV
jgi:type I restriction enzyme S subunit